MINLLAQVFNRVTIVVALLLSFIYIGIYNNQEISDEEYEVVNYVFNYEFGDEEKQKTAHYFVDYVSRTEYEDIMRLRCLRKQDKNVLPQDTMLVPINAE